jgi:hypothetical protein
MYVSFSIIHKFYEIINLAQMDQIRIVLDDMYHKNKNSES